MSLAYALVDAEKRTIRMDPHSMILAIFDTEAAAIAAQKRHEGTAIAPVAIEKPTPTGDSDAS